MGNVAQVDRGPDGEERDIVDRDILARTTGYSTETIRKRCTVYDYDPRDGRALYDRAVALAQLEAAGVVPRPHTRGKRPGVSYRRR